MLYYIILLNKRHIIEFIKKVPQVENLVLEVQVENHVA